MIPPRLSLLGVEVDAITPAEVLDFVSETRRAGARAVIANHNLHSVALCRRSKALRRFYAEAERIQIDSTPMIAWGRLIGLSLSRENRSTYLDWREAFWARAEAEGWRVFHLGGAPGVGERAIAAIKARRPGLILGGRHGFFAVEGRENGAVLADVAACRPDVLLVGMGMPRQELWIAANREHLPRCAVLPVGAAFDYEAGVVPTPPRWTGRLGLEWLWRLAAEPRRLAGRYLIEPWTILPAALGDLARRVNPSFSRSGPRSPSE